MSLEQTIMELTSSTPSGGTCWIGDIPFTVWYCSDYWEWEFQGVFFFDALDLSEAIEAFMRRSADAAKVVSALAQAARVWPNPPERKRIAFPSKRGSSGLMSGLHK
jgi:hypothetical protein